jgi:hypothetical protein
MTSALNIRNPCKQQLSVKEFMIATTSSGSNKSNMTGVNSGAGTVHPSEAHEFSAEL